MVMLWHSMSMTLEVVPSYALSSYAGTFAAQLDDVGLYGIAWRASIVIFILVMATNYHKLRDPERDFRSLFELNVVQRIVLIMMFAFFTYASTYDFAYYTLGNMSAVDLGVTSVNINFASHAKGFACVSAAVYLLRITTPVVSGEDAEESFFMVKIRDVESGRVYFPPGLPYPFFIHVLVVALFEHDLGWYIYRVPDGRHDPTMLVHR
jgi:hypothetical protein